MKLLKRYIKDREGATAIEFSMVAVPLFIGLFGIIELSYKSLLQSELDNKLYKLSFDISMNNHTADSADDFITNHFCPEIKTTFLKCSDVEIGAEVFQSKYNTQRYFTTSVVGKWDLGEANDPLVIEVVYPVQDILHPIAVADVVTREGKKYYRSRGVVRREPLLTNTSS